MDGFDSHVLWNVVRGVENGIHGINLCDIEKASISQSGRGKHKNLNLFPLSVNRKNK